MVNSGRGRTIGSEGLGRTPAFRRPQRLTITVSWGLYEMLMKHSEEQGRSLSNLACYWLERQAEDWRSPQSS